MGVWLVSHTVTFYAKARPMNSRHILGIRFLIATVLVVTCAVLAGDDERQKYVTPKLQEVWAYYSDQENCRREVCIRMFGEYLEDVPDSPFKPEIDYRIALLYLGRANERFGERIDSKVADDYLQKAHEGFGLKFCPINISAWLSYVLRRGCSLKERLEHYDYLLRLSEGVSGDDLWPAFTLPGVIEAGRPVFKNRERMEENAGNVVRTVKAYQKQAERSILENTTTPEDLGEIVKRYPGTEFAEKAQRIMDAYFREVLRVEEVLNDPTFARPADVEPTSRPDYLEEKDTEGLDTERGGSIQAQESSDDWLMLWIAGGVLLAVIVGGVSFWMCLRRDPRR